MKYIIMPLILLMFTACSVKHQSFEKQTTSSETNIKKLEMALLNLHPSVDKKEANHVATVAVLYPNQLIKEYDLVSPPLWHNTLINMDLKKRGFCYHFAQDISHELKKLKLKTLEIKWAIHKKEDYWEHNALVLTAKNQSFNQGIILDAWRNSGELYWDYIKNDDAYSWSEDIQKGRYFGTRN